MRGPAEIYVVYGVFVTTRSLLVAIDAWPQISGPLEAIETIKRERRQRTGTTSTAAALAVPDEIWDMSMSAVRINAFYEAEQGILRLAICDDCQAAESAGHVWTWEGIHEHSWETCQVGEGCCSDKYSEFPGFRADLGRRMACRHLLERYHLALPNAATVGDNPEYGLYDDLNDNAAFLISLPTTSKTSQKPHCPNAAVVLQEEFSDSVFDLCTDIPDDADQRFARLVKDLDLVVVEVTDGPIGRVQTASQGSLNDKATRRGGGGGRRCAESSTVSPKWRLPIRKNHLDHLIFPRLQPCPRPSMVRDVEVVSM